MSDSDVVKSFVQLNGHRPAEIKDMLGLSSRQALWNKQSTNSWKLSDLKKVASACGGKVGLVTSDGQVIMFPDEEDPEP